MKNYEIDFESTAEEIKNYQDFTADVRKHNRRCIISAAILGVIAVALTIIGIVFIW